MLMGQDVHAAVLGIVGLGRIGQAVARRARGFDMRVLYHDLYVSDVPPALKVTGVGLDTLLAESDFISLHVPLTEETYHLIGAGELRKCKPTTILVNTSRGGVVDADALYRALRDGEIAYAALDVTEPEPLPADHPLLSLSNCIVTPHIASASVVTRTRMAVIAAENLLAGLRGESLPHPVKVQ